MRSAWKVHVLAPLGVLLLGLVGCDSLLQTLGINSSEGESNEENSDEQIGAQVLTTSEDGNILINEEAGIQLLLPSTWSEDDRLHESAELEASDIDRQLFIVVVAEDKEPLTRRGIEENAENYRTLLMNRLQSVEGEFRTDVPFVGENFAEQYEIRGTVDGNTPVVYLHTTVLAENRYYQIVAWTTPDQYAAYKSELQTITDTFQEIDS